MRDERKMIGGRGVGENWAGGGKARKFMPDSVASALAMRVLEQPGGPYKRIPFGGATPSTSNSLEHFVGRSTMSCSACFTVSIPPISDHRTVGTWGWGGG